MVKRASVKKKPICEVKLSTGYTVPIVLSDPEEGISHLCNAFIMEIFIPNLKKFGVKKTTAKLQNEIVDVCCTLNIVSKESLLSALLWQAVLARYDEIEKKTRKAKPRKG